MSKTNNWRRLICFLCALVFLLISTLLFLWPLFLKQKVEDGPFVEFACSRPNQLLNVFESVDSEKSKITFHIFLNTDSEAVQENDSSENFFVWIHVYDQLDSFKWTCNESALCVENTQKLQGNLIPHYNSKNKNGNGNDVCFYVDFSNAKSLNNYDVFTIELKPKNYKVHVYDDDNEIYTLRIPWVSPLKSAKIEGSDEYQQTIDGNKIYVPSIEVFGSFFDLGVNNNNYFIKDFYAGETAVSGAYYVFKDHQYSTPIVKYYSNIITLCSEIRLLFGGILLGISIDLFVRFVRGKNE